MTRICIVGNSHVAALKRGWREMAAARPDVVVDMFGAYGSHLADVFIANGELRAGSPEGTASLVATGGQEFAVLADYDAIVVVGGGPRLFSIAGLMKDYCPPFANPGLVPPGPGDEALRDGLWRFHGKTVPHPVSDAFFLELLGARMAKSTAVMLCRAIAAAATAPLFHLPAPFPSADLLTLKPRNAVSRLASLGLGPVLADQLRMALGQALAGVATVIEPPERLLVDGILTDRIYGSGGARLVDDNGDHGEEEVLHMNGAYGAILMREILLRVAGPDVVAEG